MHSGMFLGIISLVLGIAADYFQGKQIDIEIRETVNEELNARLGAKKDEGK